MAMGLMASILLSACLQKGDVGKVAEMSLDKRVIHPRFREYPKPSGGILAKTNPPIMLNPLSRNASGDVPVTYSYRLSRDQHFPEVGTISQNELRYAIFNIHEKLDNGTWYWQYGSDDREWSDVHTFRISEEVPVFETPHPKDLIQSIPLRHPRVLVNPTEISAFRNRVADMADAAVILSAADALIDQMPPSESMGVARQDDSLTEMEQKKLALDASKKLGSAAGNPTTLFCEAYVLSGVEKYGQAAIRWASVIAGYDPNGVSMTNNFADSELMLAMAHTYDVCHNLLTEDEKETLLKSITVRGNRFYNGWTNMLEAKIFSGHVWQHILERLFKTSLATLHDIPEAAHWLTYVYEVWLARAPCLGPDDGGWWNGNHYMELNALTLLDIPMYLKQYTGLDYMISPWYQNNPYWLIYSFPANSWSEGFGNGTEKQFGQKLGMLGYTDALSRLTGHPYAAWYSDHHLRALGKTLEDDDEFRWFRLKWGLPERPVPPNGLDLPLARVFRETGTVNMHTDLERAEKNLMVSMRSSPYGSTSHAHSDQNSFNIQYGGEKLFYNSGYRPSMGVPHYTDWFKASIGHNTVLIDGKGQPVGSSESYGWMARFLHGGAISYALGDASNAYDNEKQVPQKAEVKRFRRHLIFMRPDVVVIYDELLADHEAEWSWLIHSHKEIMLHPGKQQIKCNTKTARSQVDIFGSTKLELELSTEFDPKPVNYRNIRDTSGKIIEFSDQWHVYARSRGKAMRYLAIFQVKDISDSGDFEQPVADEKGVMTVGAWSIAAEMNTTKPASFEVFRSDGEAALIYGKNEVSHQGDKFFAKQLGSTIMIEHIDGRMIAREAVDVFPVGRD
jgi:hypothetical protein